MTLLVTTIVRDGIAFSTDTRATAAEPRRLSPPGSPASLVFEEDGCRILTDTLGKLRVVGDRFALAVTGRLSARARDLLGAALRDCDANPPGSPAELVRALLAALVDAGIDGSRANLMVAGFDGHRACVLGARSGDRGPKALSPLADDGSALPGYLVGGDAQVVQRLMGAAAVPFGEMTLQDAVDFTRFLVWASIQQQRFDLSLKPTIGGQVETLVITPADGVRWLARQDLMARPPGPPQVSP